MNVNAASRAQACAAVATIGSLAVRASAYASETPEHAGGAIEEPKGKDSSGEESQKEAASPGESQAAGAEQAESTAVIEKVEV